MSLRYLNVIRRFFVTSQHVSTHLMIHIDIPVSYIVKQTLGGGKHMVLFI